MSFLHSRPKAVNRKNSVPAILDRKTTTSKVTGNNKVAYLLNELKSFLYFLFSLLSLHYSRCKGRRKKHQYKMSHYRSCWQLSNTVFCACLNLLLTKCSRPDALNTEVRDLSPQQTQDWKQLTTKYLLFLTCHHPARWAKRNYFSLSSLLRLPVNKAMGTNCCHDCLLGKEKKIKTNISPALAVTSGICARTLP